MNYTIIQASSNAALVIKTSGTMNGDDYVAMAKDILKHPKHKPGAGTIFDHTDLDFSQAVVEDLEKIRDFHRANEDKIGAGKSAIIVRPGFAGAWHTLWSQGQKIQTANKVQIFESRKEALEWVGDR